MTLQLLSSSFESYKTPKTLKYGNEIYKDIFTIDRREIIDADTKQKTIDYLEGMNARHYISREKGQVTRAQTYYYSPIKVKIANKEFDNIVSSTTIPGSHKVYEQRRKSNILNPNFIKVNETGNEIIDATFLHTGNFKKKLLKPLKTLGNILKTLKK